MASSEAPTLERRRSGRFPIVLEVRYRTTKRYTDLLVGEGTTVDISSSGVLFTVEHDFPVGTRIEVSIKWPMPLNEEPLTLIGRGCVARKGDGLIALKFSMHEFRIKGKRRGKVKLLN